MARKVIVALDFKSLEESFSFLDALKHPTLFVKVGMELYLQNGPTVLEKLAKKGYKIFLDLKLYDIPNTVYRTVKGLMKFEIAMLSVHAAGGQKMIQKAVQAVREAKKSCKIVCVTQLTSTNWDLEEVGVGAKSLKESVVGLAKVAKEAEADGVICSVQEVEAVKKLVSSTLLTITPGIRLKNQENQDQKRVGLPEEAKAKGSDFIVVGRAVKMVQDPCKSFFQIKQEFEDD